MFRFLFIQFPSHLPLGWKDVGVSVFVVFGLEGFFGLSFHLLLLFCFCFVVAFLCLFFFFFFDWREKYTCWVRLPDRGCRNLSDSGIFFDTVKLRVHREPASELAAMAVLTGLAFHFEWPRPLPPLPAPAPTHTHTHTHLELWSAKRAAASKSCNSSRSWEWSINGPDP